MLYKKRGRFSLFIVFVFLISPRFFLEMPWAYGEDTTIQIQLGESHRTWSQERKWSINWLPVTEQNLKTYAWQMDGGWFKEIGSATSVAITFDRTGRHQICVRAEEGTGNLNSLGCSDIFVDIEAPQTPVLIGGTNGLFSSESRHTVSWKTPADDGSGPDYYKLKINGMSSSMTAINSYEQSWADGEHHVQVAAVDHAGNQSPWSNEVVLFIDTTALSAVSGIASSTHPDPDRWYSSNAPQLTWKPPSDLSGIGGYHVYINQNFSTFLTGQYPWIAEPSYAVPEDELLASGVWYFHVAAVDKAGNLGQTSHFKIRIDFSPPSTKVELLPNSQRVVLNALDDWTPVVSTHYSLDNGPWETGDEFYITARGKYSIAYYSIDSLGNQEAVKRITVNQQYSEVETEKEFTLTETGVSGQNSFSRVEARARRAHTVVSWNNSNTAIRNFSVYRYFCSSDLTDCSRHSKVATILAAPQKRMRILDKKKPEKPFYYQIIGYGQKGKVIEESGRVIVTNHASK